MHVFINNAILRLTNNFFGFFFTLCRGHNSFAVIYCTFSMAHKFRINSHFWHIPCRYSPVSTGVLLQYFQTFAINLSVNSLCRYQKCLKLNGILCIEAMNLHENHVYFKSSSKKIQLLKYRITCVSI